MSELTPRIPTAGEYSVLYCVSKNGRLSYYEAYLPDIASCIREGWIRERRFWWLLLWLPVEQITPAGRTALAKWKEQDHE